MAPGLMYESGAKNQEKMFRKFSIGGMGLLAHNARARKITVRNTHEATGQGGEFWDPRRGLAAGDKQVQI